MSLRTYEATPYRHLTASFQLLCPSLHMIIITTNIITYNYYHCVSSPVKRCIALNITVTIIIINVIIIHYDIIIIIIFSIVLQWCCSVYFRLYH